MTNAVPYIEPTYEEVLAELTGGEKRVRGTLAESQVVAYLGALGIKAKRQPYGSPYDLDCSGVRVEVKTAYPAVKNNQPRVWQFNLHRHGVLKENYDFYIFRIEGVPDFKGHPIHLIVPAPLGRYTVIMTVRSLMVRWGKFYNELEPLQIAIENKQREKRTA